MPAAIYVRRSKRANGGHDTRSVEQQETECRDVARREGWSVYDVYRDNDLSASSYATKTRPDWERLKADIAAGRIDALITWEASRAQRDLAAYLELRELCQRHSVVWNYSGTTYDMATTDGKFRSGLDALISENETDRTSDRLRRSTRAQAAKGRPHGRPLYGYRRTYDHSTGALLGQQPDKHAAVVKEIVRRTLAGESARTLATDLNRRDEPSPAGARWSVSQIKRVLVNPSYRALRVHRGEVIGPADWEALVTDDQAALIDVMMQDPVRARSRNKGDVRYLLSGIARCGKCSARLYRLNNRGRDTYSCREGNGHLVRDMRKLDAYITTLVLTRLAQPDAVEALTGTGHNPDVDAARVEADELRARLESATTEFTAGRISAATLGRVEADLLPRIAAAETRARQAAGVPSVVVDLAEGDEDRVDAMWDALTVEQRREVIRTLLEITVLPAGKGARTFNPALIRVEWRVA